MRTSDYYFCKQWQEETLYAEYGDIVFSDEYHLPETIIAILDFMRLLVGSKRGLLFSISDGAKGPKVSRSPLGKKLIRCMETNNKELVQRTYSHYVLNPYFTLFIEKVKESALVTTDLSVKTAHLFNELADELRTEAKAAGFKKELQKHGRAANKITVSGLKYVKELFEKHAKMVVVRLDLGFSKPYRMSLSPEDLDPIYVKRSYQKLLKHVDDKFPRVGYIAKLEYGAKKSYHFHLLLFFNGQEVRSDVKLGKLVGKHWNNVITEGRGTHENCNARKQRYIRNDTLGIGTIRYSDTKLRTNLERAVRYLTKRDHYIRLMAPNVDRTFFRGVIKEGDQVRRGRRRASGSASESTTPPT